MTHLDDALVSAYAILSLLHYRGLVDTANNRKDVESALNTLRPFALEAEQRMMEAKQ